MTNKNEWPDKTDYSTRKSNNILPVLIIAIVFSLIAIFCVMNDVGAQGLPTATETTVKSETIADGFTPPTYTVTNTCTGANVIFQGWVVADELNHDEWGHRQVITRIQNATLDSDGDELEVYGESADWLFNTHPSNVITIEITSELYASESLRYVDQQVITINPDESCATVGNIEDVNLIGLYTGVANTMSWQASDNNGAPLAQITIALTEDGTWMCDEVVDVSVIGGLYSYALDTICTDKADSVNSNNIFLPMVSK